MSEPEMIEIEVAYALPHKQKIYSLFVEKGIGLVDAVKRTRVLEDFEDLDLDAAKFGIFGQAVRKPSEYDLKTGDRIEIYRPLIADPKASRRKRAEKVAGK